MVRWSSTTMLSTSISLLSLYFAAQHVFVGLQKSLADQHLSSSSLKQHLLSVSLEGGSRLGDLQPGRSLVPFPTRLMVTDP